MNLERRSGRGTAVKAAVILASILLSTCSGEVSPDKAIERMIRSYGGREGIARLTSFTGRGFIKQLPLISVAVSHPFDRYQQGGLYKTVHWNVKEGVVIDMLMTLINETDRIRWTRSGGFSSLEEWEIGLLRHRFPLVLERLLSPEFAGRRTGSEFRDGNYRIRFEEGDDRLTLVIDAREWLLREMQLESASDRSFLFHEVYGDYRKVDGIWFPNRFSATFFGRQYYEYLIHVIEIGVDFPDDFFVLSAGDTILPPPRPQAEQ